MNLLVEIVTGVCCSFNMPVNNYSCSLSIEWAKKCDGMVENEDLHPFNISPEVFVCAHNLMTDCLGPLEKDCK